MIKLVSKDAREFIRKTMQQVTSDVYILNQFGEKHQVQRSLWDKVPDDIRKRFMALDYVRVREHVVVLTEYGLEVLGYREYAL